jgi:hypothetical protein
MLLAPVMLLAACGSDDDAGGGTVPPVTTGNEGSGATSGSSAAGPTAPPGTSVPASTAGPGSLPPGADDLERAIADVVRRTGAEPAEVVVVANEEVTWRDASVGCPQKGMSYMQVLTDGTRIILQVGGRRFEYHAGGRRDVFYCANPQPPVGE